jgi:hypothetical protein
MYEKWSEGMDWPGSQYVIRRLEVLIPTPRISSIEELPQASERPVSIRQFFYGIDLPAADWSYRIEPGTEDKPGTLWLTPTAEAVEKVRAALAEIEPAKSEESKGTEKAETKVGTEAKKEEAEGSEKKQSGTEEKLKESETARKSDLAAPKAFNSTAQGKPQWR